jgi:hypothetical protein
MCERFCQAGSGTLLRARFFTSDLVDVQQQMYRHQRDQAKQELTVQMYYQLHAHSIHSGSARMLEHVYY